MPVPTPNEGESEDDFISRCISTLEHEDPDRPHDQIVAMCYTSWRESKKSPDYLNIVTRLLRIKDKLLEMFGDIGLNYFNQTLARLGGFTNTAGNIVLSKTEMPLPFMKSNVDGSVEFYNMPVGEAEFNKLDEEDRIVAGWANVPIADTYNDLLFPEAYRKSVEEFAETAPVTYYCHRHDEPDGKYLKSYTKNGKVYKSEVTDIGWFAISQITKSTDKYWKQIEEGLIRAYSIGGRWKGVPKKIGNIWVWDIDSVEITDLSHVPRPANKLSFFDLVKFEKSKSSMSQDVDVVKEGKKMSEKEKEAQKDPNCEKNEEAEIKNQLITGVDKIFKNRDKRVAQMVLETLNEYENKERKAQEESRLDKIERMFGELLSKFNALEGLIKGQGERLQKMESEPDRKSLGAEPNKELQPEPLPDDPRLLEEEVAKFKKGEN